MRLLVTRHGETQWNVLEKVNGVTDVPLTPRGEEQAKDLAARLVLEQVNVIISSPLTRAAKTAQTVQAATGAELFFDERLREVHVGTFEGVSRGDKQFLQAKARLAMRFPGGESILEAAHRVYGLIEDIKLPYQEKTVLFVCHGMLCRVINSYFEDMENEEFASFKLGNCQLLEYEL